MTIAYRETTQDELSLIEELWIKLNKIHADTSPFYSDAYNQKTFDDRKKELLEKLRQGIFC